MTERLKRIQWWLIAGLLLAVVLSSCATVYPECEPYLLQGEAQKFRQCQTDVHEYKRVEAVQRFHRQCAGRTLVCDATGTGQRSIERYPHRYCRCSSW